MAGRGQVGPALRSDPPTGPRAFVRMINSQPYLAFEQLLYSVCTDKPAFDKVFGLRRSDRLADHPEEAALLRRAMVALSQSGK